MAKGRTNLETVQDVKVSPTRQIISSSKKLPRSEAAVSDFFLVLALSSVEIPLETRKSRHSVFTLSVKST
jgi:hypothetical protein